jgi:hypothetical protein
MNDTVTDLDQTDEDILTYDVSDEALEAAAGTERGGPLIQPSHLRTNTMPKKPNPPYHLRIIAY